MNSARPRATSAATSTPELPLHELLALEAVARLGSVQAAADALHVTPSGISHRIASLERRVGSVLLQRKGRGIALSDSAQAYVQTVRPGLVELAQATEALREREHHTVRIATAAAAGAAWLLPRLREHASGRSEIRFDIRSVATRDELPAQHWDLMLHYGEHPQRGSLREPLLRDRLIRVCAPDLLGTPGRWLSADDLAQRPTLRLAQLDEPQGAAAPPAGVAQAVFDDALAMLEAAAAGAGVAWTTETAAGPYLRDGTLVRATAEAHEAARYFLDLSEAGQLKAAAKALFRWLAARAAAPQ